MTTSHSNEDMLELLAAGPKRIAASTAALTTAQLQEPAAPDQWSLNDILAHLRACADMWGRAIADILAHDHPTLKAINPRTWIKQTDYREQDFRASLQAFTTQRTELVCALESLSPEQWQRAATVTGAGKPIERTVRSFAERLATHERSHIQAIERICQAQR